MLKANIYEEGDKMHCEIRLKGSVPEIITETVELVKKIRESMSERGLAEEMTFSGAICAAAMNKQPEDLLVPLLADFIKNKDGDSGDEDKES